MTCPTCDSTATGVRKTIALGSVILRHRRCDACACEWTTEETIRHISRRGSGHGQPPVVTGDQGQPPAPLHVERLPVATNGQGQPRVAAGDQGANSAQKYDQERDPEEKKADPEFCSEPALLEFPIVGKTPGPWPLTKPFVDDLAAAFPGVDVMAEARKALVWLNANPTKRKTFAGAGRFLVGWVSRSVNSGRAARAPSPFAPGAPAADHGRSGYRCEFHRKPRTGNARPPDGFDHGCSDCKHAALLHRSPPRAESAPVPAADLVTAVLQPPAKGA